MGSPGLRFGFGAQERVICCHRATLSGRFPPNSLAAVAECVDARAPRLEIDVRFLSDDAMLVYHDSQLEHETTGAGRVDALDRAAARALRYRWDGDYAVCSLDEVVDVMRGGETLLQVDLKLMRPISAAREAALAQALAPMADRVLIGTQAHWNLAPFAQRGFQVAFDPTLQWHYAPDRPMELTPRRLGVHGLWDDAPLAHIPHASATDYAASRIADLVGLVPAAAEWMVDIATIRHLASIGCLLGERLAARGIQLAAWTMRDRGEPETSDTLRELLELGASTVIADDAPVIAKLATELVL
jgi:glycerophosphoryl diester phosphodiesterase